MKCALCNERNGNTRCEGCNTLFCLPCMNKHHDQLAQQFQLLMDIRNEVKQALDVSRSMTSNKKQVSCLIEIDTWEREIIQRIQKIAANARTNVNELLMKHINEISDRFEQMSVQIQQRQKEGDYLENDIEKIKNQLDQLKNDIKHANEKIRVDSSLSNNIEWDTLLYIVEEESPNQTTNERMPTKDKVTKEKKMSIVHGLGRGKKVEDTYDSSQLFIPINRPVARTSQSNSTLSLSNSSQIATRYGSCIVCRRPLGDLKSNGLCSSCDNRSLYPTAHNDVSSRSDIRLRPTNMHPPTSDRDYTPTLSSIPIISDLSPIICPGCSYIYSARDIPSNLEFRCVMCKNTLFR